MSERCISWDQSESGRQPDAVPRRTLGVQRLTSFVEAEYARPASGDPLSEPANLVCRLLLEKKKDGQRLHQLRGGQFRSHALHRPEWARSYEPALVWWIYGAANRFPDRYDFPL